MPIETLSRRELMKLTALGVLAGPATGWMSALAAHADEIGPSKSRRKSCILLYMNGGASHVDTFDPKPELRRRNGQPLSAELAKTIKTSFINDPGKALLRASPWEFKPGGKSGLPVSDLFPHLRDRADDICVIRSCYSDVFDHAPAIYLRNTGSQFPGRPSLGCGEAGPKSGVHPALAIFAASPSNSPRRMSSRFRRAGFADASS